MDVIRFFRWVTGLLPESRAGLKRALKAREAEIGARDFLIERQVREHDRQAKVISKQAADLIDSRNERFKLDLSNRSLRGVITRQKNRIEDLKTELEW